ncbi:MAG: efflux RND transporter periplasmic adaptor subunit [Desulfobacterales bacterium]|uniref:Efflux RND transporter periplasmic adaptor subunit n=1 Tax=Candidatus Desulfatibia vada TaxID=2841696 RepID=A0A8J6TK23_9BACT|nr:efflux RND transporter periplasmic adaptor subunit [Candidatus Desulfatibia vada]MBL6972391.1 efflux RND transporter periplasmic adaptor subunit [Desulfobacterales bacterium]
MKSKTNSEFDIGQTLGIDQSSDRKKHLKRWLIVALLAIAGVTSAVVWKGTKKSNSMQYQTQKVEQGDLTVTVTATGALEPTNQVDVGSELSGIIKAVEVDYNDRVKVGQILARLDTVKLKAEVLQSKAALESARAKVLEVRATVKEVGDELARFKQVWELSNNMVPSQHDLDAAQAALHRAKATEATARAQVSQAQATLEADETDLAKTVIHSPINGIVLTRNVEPGQTVAASFQAPVLFTLAEDLTQMELHVDVDEADVGQVTKGQAATFTVDAHPGRTFPARITQVRYGSQTVNGVVTYKTVLNVDNSDLSLRPGMTATADITVNKVENAILVPNAALRFIPPIKAKEAPSKGSSLFSRLLPRRHRSTSKQRKDSTANNKLQDVWTLRDGKLLAIAVSIGATDGRMTEVTSDDIEPGMPLVVDTMRSER